MAENLPSILLVKKKHSYLSFGHVDYSFGVEVVIKKTVYQEVVFSQRAMCVTTCLVCKYNGECLRRQKVY